MQRLENTTQDSSAYFFAKFNQERKLTAPQLQSTSLLRSPSKLPQSQLLTSSTSSPMLLFHPDSASKLHTSPRPHNFLFFKSRQKSTGSAATTALPTAQSLASQEEDMYPPQSSHFLEEPSSPTTKQISLRTINTHHLHTSPRRTPSSTPTLAVPLQSHNLRHLTNILQTVSESTTIKPTPYKQLDSSNMTATTTTTTTPFLRLSPIKKHLHQTTAMASPKTLLKRISSVAHNPINESQQYQQQQQPYPSIKPNTSNTSHRHLLSVQLSVSQSPQKQQQQLLHSSQHVPRTGLNSSGYSFFPSPAAVAKSVDKSTKTKKVQQRNQPKISMNNVNMGNCSKQKRSSNNTTAEWGNLQTELAKLSSNLQTLRKSYESNKKLSCLVYPLVQFLPTLRSLIFHSNPSENEPDERSKRVYPQVRDAFDLRALCAVNSKVEDEEQKHRRVAFELLGLNEKLTALIDQRTRRRVEDISANIIDEHMSVQALERNIAINIRKYFADNVNHAKTPMTSRDMLVVKHSYRPVDDYAFQHSPLHNIIFDKPEAGGPRGDHDGQPAIKNTKIRETKKLIDFSGINKQAIALTGHLDSFIDRIRLSTALGISAPTSSKSNTNASKGGVFI